jgi:signal peptidase I
MVEPNAHTHPSGRKARIQALVSRLRTGLAGRHPDWRRTRQSAFEVIKTLVIAFLLAQLIMVSVAQAFQVEQYSMEPTLLPHDRVLVSKFIYRFREPKRRDVIVLRYPRNPERNYIKRVVGLPGESVRIKNGILFVNGRRISEAYINGQPAGDYGPVTIPADSVFVLGDNRPNSEDSRAFGPLKRNLIVGQAVLVYWPLQRAKLIFGR